MNFTGQRVQGSTQANCNEIKFGIFIVMEVLGDGKLQLECVENEFDEDLVGEEFTVESYEVEALDDSKPSADIFVEEQSKKFTETGLNHIKTQTNLSTGELLTLGIIK